MEIISGNQDNFDEVVKNNKKKVLVDFNATWCGPCKMLGPVLEEIASENDKFQIVGVDVDENEKLAFDYRVSSIPCLVLFENGEEVKRTVGFMNKEDVLDFVGEK